MPPQTPEQKARAYAYMLLPLSVAAKIFGMSTRTFARLRKRQGVVTLPGKRVHIGDVIAAIERERHSKA